MCKCGEKSDGCAERCEKKCIGVWGEMSKGVEKCVGVWRSVGRSVGKWRKYG